MISQDGHIAVESHLSPKERKKEILSRMRERVLLLDGGMGSLLQIRGLKAGQAPEQFMLEHPEKVEQVHSAYVEAGADMVLTNTFGASPLKLRDHGLENRTEEINRLAIRTARKAAKGRALVLADIGPSGQFLKPIGSLNFDSAFASFEKQVEAIVKERPDAIIMETISDLREARAIAMAVRKHFDGLFIAQMTFTEDGTTVTGTDPLSALCVLESLGIDVFGANCSVGPEQLLPVIETLGKRTGIPISVEPNAGMPELVGGETCYPTTPERFAGICTAFVSAGANIIGGCCGTTPEFIKVLKNALNGLKPVSREEPLTSRLAGRFMTMEVADHLPVKIIGERINPTARKKFSLELKEGVLTSVRKEAVRQEKAGASILDINVGAIGVNEPELMRRAVNLVQECSRLPLSLDSSDEAAIEAGLKEVAGKCLINSVNGEKQKLDAVLPLVKEYGAAVLGLTLDGEGIPDTVEKRIEIASRIIEATDGYSIPRKDVYIDPLCLTVSTLQDQAINSLKAVEEIKKRFGVRTVLGLSNISFGMPERSVINRVFLSMALQSGLDVPIVNPLNSELMREIRASDLLLGKDRGGKIYIMKAAERADRDSDKKPAPHKPKISSKSPGDVLFEDVVDGDRENILGHLDAVLAAGELPQSINEKHLIPALLEVGRRFDKKEFYLPQVILAAEAMKLAFEKIKPLIPKENPAFVRGKVILATVKGDVHDIGKNIVSAILETHGYQVTDLGKNVESEEIVKRTLEEDADLLGLSALMTTTMTEMEMVVKQLKKKGARAGIIIGGAVTTRAFAESIGADGYAQDAMSAVPEVNKIIEKVRRA